MTLINWLYPVYPYDWDDLFINHQMVGFYVFFFLKLGLQQKVLCMIRLAKDSTSPEMFDDLQCFSPRFFVFVIHSECW